MHPELTELSRALGVFDAVDLAAGVGALQLMPINMERQLRLERLAAVVRGIEPSSEAPTMSSSRWRTLVNSPPVADGNVVSAEDPAEYLFTDPVSFIGGSHIVFPGIADDATEITRVLTESIILRGHGLPSEYVEEMKALTYAVLRVSDAVARRAEIGRACPPESHDIKRVEVPPSTRFANLKAAVTFTSESLAELLDPVSPDVLDPLTATLGADDLDPDDPAGVAAVSCKPMVRTEGRSVLLVPSALLVALRHRMIVRAIEMGVLSALVSTTRTTAARKAHRSLEWMGWRMTDWGMSDAPEWADESFWTFDIDKIAHVLILLDDLDGYDVDDPYSIAAARWFSDVEIRMDAVRQRIWADIDSSPHVFHVVIFQGLGRSWMLGISGADSGDNVSDLLVSQSDLNTIARFEAGARLALWKFARAGESLRRSTTVVTWSTLDEYGAYRSHRHSFYLTDDGRPTMAMFDTSYGAALRIENAIRFDPHGVTHWDRHSVIEVWRRWEGLESPVYVPDPGHDRQLAFLIESLPVPIWVVDAGGENESRGLRFELSEAVVYWLWQATEWLSEVLLPARGILDQVTIEVSVADWDDWEQWAGEEVSDWLVVDVVETESVTVTFRPAAQAVLSGADNEGERQLLIQLLTSVQDLVEASVGCEIVGDIQSEVDAVAPLGTKKKLLFLDSGSNLALLSGALPDVTKVDDAEIEMLLDEAGAGVAETLGLGTGPIDDDDRGTVLNEIVAIHLSETEVMISSLTSEGLLERLIGHHEAIVHAAAHQRLTVPTQLACFGAESNMLSNVSRNLDDLMRADQALRFLVEYVAAQPPNGSGTLSLSGLHRLMALATEIMNKGSLSDSVYYGLADVKISRLASGRLGIDRGGRFLTGIDAYRPVKAASDIDSARRRFGSNWESLDAGERPDSIDQLDAASKAEFGLTMTEIAHLIGDITNLGLQTTGESKVLRLETVVAELAASLKWTPEKVTRAIDVFSLRRRDPFVPAERSSDVYPWRFNRDLSYVRRPLVIRETPGTDEVIFGVRHLDRVRMNLLSLIQSGRLKAVSPEMRSYMGSIRCLEAEAFNDEVAEAFAKDENLVVRKRVTKVGSAHIRRPNGEDLGDVDVLIVDAAKRIVKAVEVKDLELARTPAELSNELAALFGAEDSAVARHGERVGWLREHLDDVLRWLEVPKGKGKWLVEGLIVTSRPLVTPYLADSPFDVVVSSDLDQANRVAYGS